MVAGTNQYGLGRRQVQNGAALNNTVQITRFTPRMRLDIPMALSDSESRIKTIVSAALMRHMGIKWYIVLTARYTKQRDTGEWITNEQAFTSNTVPLLDETNIDPQMAAAFQQVFANSQAFEAEGSGWSLEEIEHVAVQTVAYQPLQASSYIPMPDYILHKRAVVNVKNYDNKCLLWSILACLHPAARDKDRLSNYVKYQNELNMTGVSFPTPLSQIDIVEKKNNMSINVFGYDEENKVYPLRVSSSMREKHVNVLHIANEKTSHYCWISNFSRLVGNRTKHKAKAFYCYNCLHGFTRKQLLDQHKELCYEQRTQKIKFPVDTTARFKSIHRQLRAPFIIYADFECYTARLATCANNPKQSHSTAYQLHEPSGFCYVVVSAVDRFTKPAVVYRGESVVDTFLDYLSDETHEIFNVLANPLPMRPLTDEQKHNFATAQNCHICGALMGKDRVRDHDHLTGLYRGAAHNECNLAYRFDHRLGRRTKNETADSETWQKRKRMEYIIPVVFHNLRGYDAHLLMSGIGKYKKRRIKCIPNNTERYLSVSLGCLRFIDSYQFMAAPLDKLVANLESEHFHQMRRNIRCRTQQTLLLRKGVYPYDYVDCARRLTETALPPKKCFFSELTQEHITDNDYTHAKAVWREFGCRTLGDYHDVYLKADVLLLADVFERFRTTSLDTYKLDPAHYFTSPGLAWDAMLRHTGIKLQLLTDPDMILMIERGIRGGVSMITKKHALGNNPYCETYDSSKPTTYLMYYDANNLYGWAMSTAMPEKDFAWCTAQELEMLDVAQIEDDSTTGYFLEVDLEYPPELHDLHNDYPLAPEQRAIAVEELSPHTQRLRKKLRLSDRPQTKLVPTLHPKRRYVVHYRALKLYLQLGLRLLKVHRALRFTQSQWLRPYIMLNTEKRKQATNAFEKDFFKLMNNSVFGKTMENVRSRINLELVHREQRMKTLSCRPNFHRVVMFNKDLVAAQCLKSVLCLDKPIYVGCTILDVSKTLMYWFHYEHIKHKYGNRAQLCFTDTDSLLYEFHDIDDIYRDMQDDLSLFDTSDYPGEHPLHSSANKKVLGKMKDEMAGKAINEFVGLRSKMYSILCGKIEKKTAKGIKRATIKHDLRHDKYRKTLLDETCTDVDMNLIRSRRHQLYSEHVHKQALSPYDDKRYVLDDKVSTRAHGHQRNKLGPSPPTSNT